MTYVKAWFVAGGVPMSTAPVAREADFERTRELLRLSNERIRVSLDLLDQDVPAFMKRRTNSFCPSCNIEMAWSRSSLDITKGALVHVFICSTCGSITETKTRARWRFEQ
ncbi:MAG: hypothetical protein KGI99_21055 [Bradyrhizobium sp.]|nr:hypothetical protein [Pseudomonadota bacterium]MDE2069604.1 hypothetical protein [Bradyrhizobium sp.]